MISGDNPPLNSQSLDPDFTVDSYRQLLVLAKRQYPFVLYDEIPWGQRFVLWRHDCDFSLNRAHALACAESSESVRATYFVNLHSEFYNVFERGQHRLVREILGMGHRIGLHFDSAFYEVSSEASLVMHLRHEADLLENLIGVRPSVFSFHNPLASHLGCEQEYYGELLNCYSRRFKEEVPYCSDSNGYWRFRRLRDVLTQGTDPCLQVLTHPGWWQETAMPPRQRIFRCVYGRAQAALASYDADLQLHGRENLAGPTDFLGFLRDANPQRYRLLDSLWMSDEFQALFVELWRLHESQINNLCKAVLCKQWQVPAKEVNAFFESLSPAIDGWRLFEGVFGQSLEQATGTDPDSYREWMRLRNQLMHGRGSAAREDLEQGCTYVCMVVESLAAWGRSQPIAYDGLGHIESIGILAFQILDGTQSDRLDEATLEIPGFPTKHWAQFKTVMASSGGEIP